MIVKLRLSSHSLKISVDMWSRHAIDELVAAKRSKIAFALFHRVAF
jgi:hypothetical protein